jgi:NAD(P)-dependent dehydrogenase (short-subunit alcohol dehydrogenase family)
MTEPRKVALVIGACRGSGAALVPAYLKLGCAVVATARNVETSNDRHLLTVSADVSQAGSGARIVNAAVDRFGRVDTLVPPETCAKLASLHPIGRMGEIDDVVDAIIYLERAPFVTGEILHVDGGQSAGH